MGSFFARPGLISGPSRDGRGAYINGLNRGLALRGFMRATGTVLVFLLFLSAGVAWPLGGVSPAYAQQDSTMLVQVQSAFRSADVEALLHGAAERVDVVIFGKGASYSRAQASLVLLDFFRRNPPRDVAFEQQVIAEDRRSMIGHYWGVGGAEPMAISVRMRARDEGWQIRSIRIERRVR